MNLMFWKKKTGAQEDAQENLPVDTKPRKALDFVAAKESPEPESADTDGADLETPVKLGIAASLKMRLGALVRHFKKPPVFRAHEEPEQENAVPEEPATATYSKKWLVAGVSIGLLVLLLAALTVAYWPTSEPPQEQVGTRHEAASASSHLPDSRLEPASNAARPPEQPQSDVEALRKENAELQAQVEALKKQTPIQRQLTAPSQNAAGNSSAPAAAVGDMIVNGNDPKATAKSLKEAIEAMNASTGDYKKKPAK